MVAKRGRPVSNLDTSRVASFSMVVWMSLMGRPMRLMPFSIILATGLSVFLQSLRAASTLPSQIKSRRRFMKLGSIFEAFLMATNLSTKM